jgi:hypothetical protein
MSELQLAEGPPKRVRVTERADGILIRLPLREFSANVAKIIVGLVCSALAITIFYAGYTRSGLQPIRGDDELFIMLVVYSGVFLTLVVIGLDLLGRRVTFTVAGDELVIRRSGLLWWRTWRWPRTQLRWITAHQGIQVIGIGIHWKRFEDETGPELSWIAQALQKALHLEPESEPSSGEIAVGFTDDPNKIMAHGFLFTQPGRMAVRPAHLAGYAYEFVPAPPSLNALGLWRMWRGTALPLVPEQVQCKNEDDETACMQIIRTEWPLVWLTIWCDDKTALQRAVARFWGNEYEG